MEFALDISFTDWPVEGPAYGVKEVREWREHTWGERGLAVAMETAAAAGARRVHFRVHSAGPLWPSKVAGTTPYNWGLYSRKLGLVPDMAEWNMVEAAVQVAHRKGLKILGWFDVGDGHAGLPTAWSLAHPQFCVVNRDGVRLDGPVGLVGNDGTVFDKSMLWMDYDELIAKGFMTNLCERPDGTSIDPQLSLAYPEVVEYRLALLREVLDFGFDGVFLAVYCNVGYEGPVRESFGRTYGIDPVQAPQDDPRWIKHQQGYFTEFVRRVCDLVRAKQAASGRRLELMVEGQSGIPAPGYQEPEIGCKTVPNWASMPAFVDVERIAQEHLVDTLGYWTFREIDALSPAVRQNVKIGTRYRWYREGDFGEDEFRARLREAENRGLSVFIINENRAPLALYSWMYPGKPGPLFDLTQRLRAAK